jgi:hypothetical protein
MSYDFHEWAPILAIRLAVIRELERVTAIRRPARERSVLGTADGDQPMSFEKS